MEVESTDARLVRGWPPVGRQQMASPVCRPASRQPEAGQEHDSYPPESAGSNPAIWDARTVAVMRD